MTVALPYHLRNSVLACVALALAALWAEEARGEEYKSAQASFRVTLLAEGLEHPWGMAFLPDGGLLITERPGRLRLFRNGTLEKTPISGLPEVAARGQGGLLDVALHPEFPDEPWVYISFARPGEGGAGTAVARGRLEGGALRDLELLFDLPRKTSSGQHFGSRLVFDRQGFLYVTVGERGQG